MMILIDRNKIKNDYLYEISNDLNEAVTKLSKLEVSSYSNCKNIDKKFNYIEYNDNNKTINEIYRTLFNSIIYKSKGFFKELSLLIFEYDPDETEIENIVFIFDKMILNKINKLKAKANLELLNSVKSLTDYVSEIHDFLYKYNVVSKTILEEFRKDFKYFIENEEDILKAFGRIFNKLNSIIENSDANCLNVITDLHIPTFNLFSFQKIYDENDLDLKRFRLIKELFFKGFLKIENLNKAFRMAYKYYEEEYSEIIFIKDIVFIIRYKLLLDELTKKYDQGKSIVDIIIKTDLFEDIPSNLKICDIIKEVTYDEAFIVKDICEEIIEKRGDLSHLFIDDILYRLKDSVFNVYEFVTEQTMNLLK